MANTQGNEGPRCIMCNQEAEWARSTQFARDHLFCDRDARLEMDFTESDPNYAIWAMLDPIEKDRQRLTSEFTD